MKQWLMAGAAISLLAGLMPVPAIAATVPARTAIRHNGVTCTPIKDPALNGNYPDDGHAFWCGSAVGDTRDGYAMVEAAYGMAPIMPTLKNAGVKYFLFPSRAISNKFWGGGVNADNASYCGHTGYSLFGLSIAVSVWADCSDSWTGKQDADIWINEVTRHESGHALDYAFAKKQMIATDNPSRSKGFMKLVEADLAGLDKAGHLPTCQEFGDARTPSGVESGWPKTHLPAVCDNNAVVNKVYGGDSNQAIAKKVSAYFVAAGNLYQDVWAQEMVFQSGGPGTVDVVPATDGWLGAATCSEWAARNYYLFQEPPPAASYPRGCPQVNPGSFH